MGLASSATVLRGAYMVLLSTTCIPYGRASVGVVDINDLLQPGSPRFLSSAPAQSQKPSGKGPWTHTPECTPSTSLNNLGTKYCVYSNNRTFVNGISLVSTAASASFVTDFLDEEPVSYFLPVEKVQEWYTDPRPFKIAHIPGKDKGVVATRKINQYETFLVDQASIAMDLEMEKAVSKAENARMLKLAIDQLRRPHLVRQLSSKHRGDAGENEDEDIMMTNSFGTQIGELNFRGVFPLVSRINHACDPNAFVMFSQSGLSIGIKAYRDILPGEEINISYLLLGMVSEKRHEGLKRWGFKCTCSQCSLPDPEKAASDARRKQIAELEPKLSSLWRQGRHQGAIRVGEEVVELMKEEGLTPMLTDEYVILARLYLIRGEREMAQEYADMALEILENLGFLGTESKDEWDLERLLGAWSDEIYRPPP